MNLKMPPENRPCFTKYTPCQAIKLAIKILLEVFSKEGRTNIPIGQYFYNILLNSLLIMTYDL